MANIADIIGDNERVKKLASKLGNSNSDSENSSPEDYRAEYEGKRTRREGSLENIQKNKIIGSEGKTKNVVVNKYRFNFIKKIVRFSVAMLFGGEQIIEADHLDSEKEDLALEDFKKLWNTFLKMKSTLMNLTRNVKIETRSAVIFYAVEAKENQIKRFKNSGIKTIIKSKIIASKNGDFAPHFDDNGDMDAFLYMYKIEAPEDENKTITKLDIYTDEHIFSYSKTSGDWGEPEQNEHKFTVIPVVYVEQELPEWEDVASLVDGYEVRVSKLGDANDYTGDPLLLVKGKVDLPEKHQVGKVLSFKGERGADNKVQYGDAEYLTHDQLPESNKLEIDTLRNGIHSGTSTPDISLEEIKGLGALSGASIQMMFLDPIIKAIESREVFDLAVKRCISIVKNGMASFMGITSYGDIEERDFTAKFNWPLPTNEKEFIELLGDSVEDKILSKKTATSHHPLVKDANSEFEQIQAEQKAENDLLMSTDGESHD